jgi:hypothetical protein
MQAAAIKHNPRRIGEVSHHLRSRRGDRRRLARSSSGPASLLMGVGRWGVARHLVEPKLEQAQAGVDVRPVEALVVLTEQRCAHALAFERVVKNSNWLLTLDNELLLAVVLPPHTGARHFRSPLRALALLCYLAIGGIRLIPGSPTQAPENEPSEPPEILTTTPRQLMIKSSPVGASTTVCEPSQMDVVGLGALGYLGHTPTKLPWFVSGLTHDQNLPRWGRKRDASAPPTVMLPSRPPHESIRRGH